MFKLKTPRDNALFMTGMTFGACVGLLSMVLAFGGRTSEAVVIFTPLVMGATMGFACYTNYKKFKELDK